ARQQHKRSRKEQIELLLDRKRPRVQKRRSLRGIPPIPAKIPPDEEVRKISKSPQAVPPDQSGRRRQEKIARQHQNNQHREYDIRHESLDSAQVKLAE